MLQLHIANTSIAFTKFEQQISDMNEALLVVKLQADNLLLQAVAQQDSINEATLDEVFEVASIATELVVLYAQVKRLLAKQEVKPYFAGGRNGLAREKLTA
jgi:hypothetical protein